MSNIIDYLEWRGDIPFSAAGFNEIDNLILSVISYIDFSDIVTSSPRDGSVTLAEADRIIHAKHENRQSLGLIISDITWELERKAAKSVRFSDIKLSHYVDRIDEELEMQFSAITFELPDRSLFIAFRGTDDTLVGWKENFNMSFSSPVPAQVCASDYLQDTAAMHHRKPIRLGGHSKGGNLAVWAAVNCTDRIKRQIIAAYNNDGPGFESSITDREEYRKISDRIITFVPESSVVGMLLEHSESYTIVKSTQTALMQHDPFSWELIADHFICARNLSNFSVRTDKTLTDWISSMSADERRELTDLVFGVMESTGAKTLSDLNGVKLKTLGALVHSLNVSDKKNKDNILKLLQSIFEFDRLFQWKQ